MTITPAVPFETVHLHEQLVQRLFALIVAAAQACAALTADRIDFIDEDDAGRMLLRLLEHVAHARGAHADEHFHEVGTGNTEERNLGFAGDSARQQAFYRCPGLPTINTPRGIRPPSFWNLLGSRRNSTSSETSSLASSQPATSAKVT